MIDRLGKIIPLRITLDRIRSYAFRTKQSVVIEKLIQILDRSSKKRVLRTWKGSLDLWNKRLLSIKKLFNKSRLKTTSKVLQKWYSYYKFEGSMIQSVCHRDFKISMYEILGNTQSLKQFIQKYHSVFVFMMNRYMTQWLKPENYSQLKHMYLTLRKDKSTFVVIDLTETERKSNPKIVSPVKNTKDYSHLLLASE